MKKLVTCVAAVAVPCGEPGCPGAESHLCVIGAAVGFAPDVGDGESEIDQPVSGERQWRIVESLQHRAGDGVSFALATLTGTRMKRDLVLLCRPLVHRRVGDARLADRNVRQQRSARRLVIDPLAAEPGLKAAVGRERIVNGSANRCIGAGHDAGHDDVLFENARTIRANGRGSSRSWR